MRACKNARVAAAARAVAVGAIALAAAHPAGAQYTKTETPTTRFRLGPVRLVPKIGLSAAGQDSNVFLDPVEPRSDTSAVLRGSLEAHLPVGRRIRLSGETWLAWNYFQEYDSEASVDPGLRGRLEFDLGPFTLVGGASGSRARQLYSIDIDERTERTEDTLYGGLEWRPTRRLSLSGGVRSTESRYAEGGDGGNPVTAASLDRDTLTTQADFRYVLTSLTTFLTTAQVIEDEFLVAAPGYSTTRSYRYLAGFEFAGKGLFNGRLLAGIRDFPSDSSGSLPSYRGPAFSVDLGMPVGQAVRFGAGVVRDVFVAAQPVVDPEERLRNAYILLTLRLSADFDLPLRLRCRLNATFEEAEYLLPVAGPDGPVDRLDRFSSYGGSLLRRISDSFSIGGTATFHTRTSTLPGNSYDRWVWGLSAEFAP